MYKSDTLNQQDNFMFATAVSCKEFGIATYSYGVCFLGVAMIIMGLGKGSKGGLIVFAFPLNARWPRAHPENRV